MRDRLIELWGYAIESCKSFSCADCEHNNINYPKCMDVHIADYLLANGVIVPPCKVGDKVYTVQAGIIREYDVFEFRFDGDVMWFWAYNDEYPPYFQKQISNVPWHATLHLHHAQSTTQPHHDYANSKNE